MMAIITISRGTLSGGQSLAECISVKLGYRLISREIMVDAAKEYGVQVEKLVKALDQPPGFLERLTSERYHYITFIQAYLVKAVRDGNVVYHGHAGHFLLKGFPHVLRVRIIANMEFRIKNAMARHDFNREEAIEFIRKRDDERTRWTRFLYHADLQDPSLYDIVVNLDEISLSTACQMVCDAVLSPEFQGKISVVEREIQDAILAAEVRAAISARAKVGDRRITIEAHDGVVTIGGTIGSMEEADKVREIAIKIPGVRDIYSHINIYPYW